MGDSLPEAKADFADGVFSEARLEFLQKGAFPNPFELKVYRGLKDVYNQEAVGEFCGSCVFCEKVTDDFFPRFLDFFFSQALFEAELSDEFVEGLRNRACGIANERFFGETSPFGEHTCFELRSHQRLIFHSLD